jgi:hypothetical protein
MIPFGGHVSGVLLERSRRCLLAAMVSFNDRCLHHGWDGMIRSSEVLTAFGKNYCTADVLWISGR